MRLPASSLAAYTRFAYVIGGVAHAVIRWRDNYPICLTPEDGKAELKKEFYSTLGKGVRKGPRVEASSRIFDGTRYKDVTDLKRYVIEQIDVFSTCGAKKLLVYACGRPLSCGDELAVEQVVAKVRADGNGFKELMIAFTKCDPFSIN